MTQFLPTRPRSGLLEQYGEQLTLGEFSATFPPLIAAIGAHHPVPLFQEGPQILRKGPVCLRFDKHARFEAGSFGTENVATRGRDWIQSRRSIRAVTQIIQGRVQTLNRGTGGRTRTGTMSPSGDFESPASTIPPHRHAGSHLGCLVCASQYPPFQGTSTAQFHQSEVIRREGVTGRYLRCVIACLEPALALL